MKDRIVSGIFSISGSSLLVGAAGFLSALVTMFVDVNATVSVKWLIFATLLGSTITLILLKIISDLSLEKKPPPPFEIPIKFIGGADGIFVIRRNENFLNSIIVGCYSQRDGVDKLAYLAVVHLVQEKMIQIKIRTDLGVFNGADLSADDLKTIEIRPVVPVTAFELFGAQEI